VTDQDCFIPAIDLSSKETGNSLSPALIVDGRVQGALDEGNLLYGPFGNPGGVNPLDAAFGSYNNTLGAVIRNNLINASGSSFGITLAGNGLLTTTVTQNIVNGANVGLGFQQNMTTSFGAKIFLNDVTGSLTRGVSSIGTYTLPSELSFGGAGNYWGHSEAPGFRVSDTNNPSIHDSHPFCQSVATQTRVLPSVGP
jgi:hypothetical protein